MKFKLNTIHRQDCIKGMKQLPDGSIDLAFADPPFNIGYEYDEYDDRRECDDYLGWSKQWLSEVVRVLKENGTFWLAIGDEYAAELKVMMTRELGLTCRSWVIWYYTFGVNCKYKFSRSHAHLFYMVKDPKQFTFNADDPNIRIPSARQLVYGDKRANPKGRLPDDTWILRPQDIPESFQPGEDTWYFPRVNGTFKERAGWHGCQMPEQLLGRIIRACSQEGETVLDPFAGSGTTLSTAKKLVRKFLGYELSEEYAEQAQQRLKSIKTGDLLDGAENPLISAPSTENGTRLEARKQQSAKTQTTTIVSVSKRTARMKSGTDIRRVVLEAFGKTHDGFSSDFVIANPDLDAAFIEECLSQGVSKNESEFNRTLMRLRKSGKLNVKATRRFQPSKDDIEKYIFASEIAARKLLDRGYSLDDVLCDPKLAKTFDRIARSFAPGFNSLQYRWGALRIRKAEKSRRNAIMKLKKKTKNRRLGTEAPITQVDITRISSGPGVYQISDENKKELYIGETSSLQTRLQRQFVDGRLDCWSKYGDGLVVRCIADVEIGQQKGLQGFHIERKEPILNFCTRSPSRSVA